MEWLIWLLPIVLVLFTVGWRAWKTWHDGFLVALLRLTVAVVGAVVAFIVTRLLVDPAKMDIFGLGARLVALIPEGFFVVNPRLEAFFRAFPTAIAALLVFTVLFEILHVAGNRLVRYLNEKFHLSKLWGFPGHRILAVVLGALTAAVCLMTDLVVINGLVPFSANMLCCAETATGQEVFAVMADAVHTLEENPVIRISNDLGCRKAFYELTTARRDGEPFSVGEEMIRLSETFVGLLPVFEVLEQKDGVPSPEALRQLPASLGEHPDTEALLAGLIHAYSDLLGKSDAVEIMSHIMDSTPQRFSEYMAQLTDETAHEDFTTFCNVAAMLGDAGLLQEEGGVFNEGDMSPDLKAAIHEELAKNENLKAFFGLE